MHDTVQATVAATSSPTCDRSAQLRISTVLSQSDLSGLAAPQSSIPVFERSRRPPPDPERDARLERLKAARNAIAQRLDLAPGVLCANGLLEAIANQNPDRAEELEAIPDMRRWQREVLGKELIEAAKATS